MPPVPGGVSLMHPTVNALKVFLLQRGQRQNLYSAGNPSLAQLLEEADENLFNDIRYNPNHSLHYLLPKETERSYSLRSRSHNLELSCTHNDRNFIDRMLFTAYHTI